MGLSLPPVGILSSNSLTPLLSLCICEFIPPQPKKKPVYSSALVRPPTAVLLSFLSSSHPSIPAHCLSLIYRSPPSALPSPLSLPLTWRQFNPRHRSSVKSRIPPSRDSSFDLPPAPAFSSCAQQGGGTQIPVANHIIRRRKKQSRP